MGGNQDISVVFCIDISGSMCVSQAVEGKHNIKGDRRQQMQGLMSFSDGSDQFFNAADKNKTYVSRIQCLKAAINAQIEDMSKGANKRKVGVVTFNNEVTVIGDGTKPAQVITGDKLLDFDYLENNGKTQAASHMQNSIGETAKVLADKIMAIEETGPTAMGPAVLTSIGLACQGKPGSTVVVCTDGLANVGLGAFDEAKTEEDLAKVNEFYERVGQIAQQAGITINIVSIAGDECKIEYISKLAELTGGQVERVNPTNLTKDFANILALPVIATKVEAKVKLHKGLEFRNENPADLSDDKSLLARSFGNVTEENVFTFEYTLKPISELVKMEDLNLEEIKYFPFQTMISYTSLDGARLLRVITKKMEVSTDREELERKADFKLISENAMQKGS